MATTYNPKELQDALDALIEVLYLSSRDDSPTTVLDRMLIDIRLNKLMPYLMKSKQSAKLCHTGDKLLDEYFTADDITFTIDETNGISINYTNDKSGHINEHRWNFQQFAEHLAWLIDKKLVKMANTALATQSKEE